MRFCQIGMSIRRRNAGKADVSLSGLRLPDPQDDARVFRCEVGEVRYAVVDGTHQLQRNATVLTWIIV